MLDFGDLPSSHGAYVLHLTLRRPQTLAIGRLGHYRLPAGHYFYMGSARGAGGLQARVGRHLRGDGALRWHVDYVRAVAEVREVFYTVADKPLECEWSQALARLRRAFIPVPHFGSSDCRSGCDAHLIAFLWDAELAGLPLVLEQSLPAPLVPLRSR